MNLIWRALWTRVFAPQPGTADFSPGARYARFKADLANARPPNASSWRTAATGSRPYPSRSVT
jgi:hypothetical protein